MGAGTAGRELARGGAQGSSARPTAVKTRIERELEALSGADAALRNAFGAHGESPGNVDISYMNTTSGLFSIVKHIVFYE